MRGCRAGWLNQQLVQAGCLHVCLLVPRPLHPQQDGHGPQCRDCNVVHITPGPGPASASGALPSGNVWMFPGRQGAAEELCPASAGV